MDTSFTDLSARETRGTSSYPNEVRNAAACVACRKRKIKCHMIKSTPPCTRCRTRKQPCTLAKSARLVLEDEKSWQNEVEQRLDALETLLSDQTHQGATASFAVADQQSPQLQRAISTTSSLLARIDAKNASHDLSCSLGAFPASSVHDSVSDSSSLAMPGSFHNKQVITVTPDDLLVNSDMARNHFRYFQNNLNHLVYGVLAQDDTLQSIYKRSTLLAIALCTVVSYCTGADDYERWLERFKSFVIEKTFCNRHTFDDVRALCVGAFWLDELATALNALAVRISSELNLHRCTTKMPHTKKTCYDRTRLYFLVYVVDHRCSLSHGRPPMTQGIKHGSLPRQLLQCEFSGNLRTDLELVAEFELWGITTCVFDTFGADIEKHNSAFIDGVKSFEITYNKWLEEWTPVLAPLTHLLVAATHTYMPRATDRILKILLSSAKLFLFSHIFRGPQQREARPPIEATDTIELRAIALQAVDCASEIVRSLAIVIRDLLSYNVIPSYVGMMAAFASMILHRTSHSAHIHLLTSSRKQLYIDSLRELHSALKGSLNAVKLRSDTSEQSSRPLLRLAYALDRLLDHADTGPNLETLADRPEVQVSAVVVPSDLHRHSPYSSSNEDFFATELTDFGLPFVDNGNFDWLDHETLPVMSDSPEVNDINVQL